MGLSRTVSEINSDFVKITNFPTPVYLTPPLKGVLLDFYGMKSKRLE